MLVEFSPKTSSYRIRGGDRETLLHFRAGVYHPGVLAKAEVNSPRSPGESASTPGRANEGGRRVQWRAGALRNRRPAPIQAPPAWPLASGPGGGVSSRGWLLWPPGRRRERQHLSGVTCREGNWLCDARGSGAAPGTLRGRRVREEVGSSLLLTFPSRGEGVDRMSQVRRERSITQPMTGPTPRPRRSPPPGLNPRSPCAAGPDRLVRDLSAGGLHPAPQAEPARLRAAPEPAGQQWALAILLCPTRSPEGPASSVPSSCSCSSSCSSPPRD